ncbi:hypothetical protein Slin14017_G045820 [Septoria linicola]|nr:hypothetical protein Slin14017_G045820 [Septoria linicola]
MPDSVAVNVKILVSGALSDQWQRIPIKELSLTTDDPVAVDFFRNIKTGSINNHDPRMTKEALEARGVRFECVRFI